ncbi:hypothetical protein F2Q69_00030986 [Brassica cretica]|uniref:MATH domain-containing protein n=1 Tax=Brassica cretica TaxID=69181 RepID=A0A8S9RWU8_BRACR|nr:hypothetical protein F2Q69_00030986 [Brassica cretica]
MDGTFLMLHSKLFDQGSLIVFGWRRRRKKAIGRIFSVWKFSPDKEKHWKEADSISHISIVYGLGPVFGLAISLKDLSVHGCQETPHVPELDLTHTLWNHVEPSEKQSSSVCVFRILERLSLGHVEGTSLDGHALILTQMAGDGWERFRQLSTKVRVKNVAVEATEKELRQSVHLAGNSAIAEVLVLCIVWVYDYLIYKVEYRLANGHVEPSPEFFYAGSMWKISIQAFNDEDTQGHRTIGLFLHHREAEITDSISTKHDDPFQRGSQSSKEGSIQRILTMKKMSKRGFSLSGWNENQRRDRASCNAISLSSNGRLGGIR